MDLSETYNSLFHDHLIVKLETYGLDKPSLNLVNGYLRFRKQKKKIGTSYTRIFFYKKPVYKKLEAGDP